MGPGHAGDTGRPVHQGGKPGQGPVIILRLLMVALHARALPLRLNIVKRPETFKKSDICPSLVKLYVRTEINCFVHILLMFMIFIRVETLTYIHTLLC